MTVTQADVIEEALALEPDINPRTTLIRKIKYRCRVDFKKAQEEVDKAISERVIVLDYKGRSILGHWTVPTGSAPKGGVDNASPTPRRGQ